MRQRLNSAKYSRPGLIHGPFKCGRIQGQDDRIARDHERVAHARACKFVAVIANLEALDDFRFLG